MDEEGLIASIRAQLEREPEVDLHHARLSLRFDRGDLLIDGEVGSVAAKKLALERAAAVPEVHGIVDRLHVAPAEKMSDGELLDRVLRALAEESSLLSCGLASRSGERVTPVRAGLPEPRGQIEVRVEEGVVTLDGEVPSLNQKRLAESLAWWVPGTRDVVNGLGVTPPEEDSDDEITEALQMVLQKDPLLKGLKIGVNTDHRVVTLAGVVPSEAQRRAAESDGWALFGVDRVVSALEVRGHP